MTDAEMLQAIRISVDEIGGIAPFYNDPSDYYEALNEAQLEVLNEAIGDGKVEVYRALIMRESKADGATLTNHCVQPLSVYDAVSGFMATLRYEDDFNTYASSSLPNFRQAHVTNDTLHTTPAAATFVVSYIRPPVLISSGVSCELSEAEHPFVWIRAVQILLKKDIDASGLEMIEAYRNKLEIRKLGKATQTPQGFSPEQVPYQQR